DRRSDRPQIRLGPLFRHQNSANTSNSRPTSGIPGPLLAGNLGFLRSSETGHEGGAVLREFGGLTGVSRSWPREGSRVRNGMNLLLPVFLLAACLGGCGGYTALDPDSTSAISFSGGSTAAPVSSSPSDRRDAATLNALFAGSAADRADDAAVTRPTSVASAA